MSPMRRARYLFLFLLLLALPAHAQYIAVGAGGLLSQDLNSPQPSGVGGPARSEFSNTGILAVDAGIGFFPFLAAGLHYSYARLELFLRRGDSFGSNARVDLGAHTLTFEARLRTPEVSGFRLYGLAGVGFSRFALDVKQAVETPFPGGAPDNVLSPVGSIGGGIEKSVVPLLRVKIEARDYITPVSENFFRPGGAWHRTAILGGIVLGR